MLLCVHGVRNRMQNMYIYLINNLAKLKINEMNPVKFKVHYIHNYT